MKWITIHQYTDLETGETTKEIKETIIIIKKTKQHDRRNQKLGITTVTNYYRKPKWKEQELQFYTTEHTISGKRNS